MEKLRNVVVKFINKIETSGGIYSCVRMNRDIF